MYTTDHYYYVLKEELAMRLAAIRKKSLRVDQEKQELIQIMLKSKKLLSIPLKDIDFPV